LVNLPIKNSFFRTHNKSPKRIKIKFLILPHKNPINSDSRNKYYEKRRLSPHSKSPIRHNEQLANPNQQKASTYISYPIEVPKNRARQDAARAKQVWEYNSHVNRPVGRQSRSGRQTVTATVVEVSFLRGFGEF
jgi:hypothetical protein